MKMEMKIKFELPEEKEEFELYMNGSKYFIILNELDNWLRGIISYGNVPEEKERIYQEVRDKIYDFTQSKGVKL